MKKIADYLKQELNSFPAYDLTKIDERVLVRAGVASYIFKKASSRKFRCSSIPSELQEDLRARINQKVKNNKPLVFAIPTGGYKKRQLKSAPEVDWAEFFNISFMCQYAAPILAAYKPGVLVEYVSNEIDMEILGNYSRKELESYTQSFKELLSYFQKIFPTNFRIVYREMRNQFGKGEYKECLKRAKPDLDKLYEDWEQLSKKAQDRKIAKARRNYKFSKNEEKISEEEKREIFKKLTLMHDMYISHIWLGFLAQKDYIRNDDKIPVSYYHCPWGIHLGSCSSSTIQSWVGTGVLELRKERIVPRILSHRQYQKLKNNLQSIPVKLINLPNFVKIEVLKCP